MPLLNVAHICPATRALGPGLRAVVWVQGCCFHCPGCVAPEWIPFQLAKLIPPEPLAERLVAQEKIEGLTFSGGEPMLQAAGLALLARTARQKRPDISIICYTGFTLEQLRQNPPGPGVAELLSEIDVLIDGHYIASLNDNRGLRGSVNQRVHYLSDRLRGFDFEKCSRNTEIHVMDGEILLVGVPSEAVSNSFLNLAELIDQGRRERKVK